MAVDALATTVTRSSLGMILTTGQGPNEPKIKLCNFDKKVVLKGDYITVTP